MVEVVLHAHFYPVHYDEEFDRQFEERKIRVDISPHIIIHLKL